MFSGPENLSRPVSRVVGEVCRGLITAASGGEQDTEALAAGLSAHGLAAGHYHADMDPSERMRVHTAWSAGKACRQYCCAAGKQRYASR